MQIGFVVLSHNNPAMLLRLIGRLNKSFHDPPIVCHHDTHQSNITGTVFPRNVSFVRDPIRTRWGHISLVHALRIGLRQLYQVSRPDWFVVLSSCDYPIRPADDILAELSVSPFDAYLDHRRVPAYADLPDCHEDGDYHLGYDRPFWIRKAYNRYVAFNVKYPGINRKLRPLFRRFPIHSDWLIRNSPFKDGLACYAGDAWLTARARCAEVLASDSALATQMLRHYEARLIPDESFFQTMLCNSPGLTLCRDNKRYTDWGAGRPNPKVLGMDDLPILLRSTDHFARKFSIDHDSRVLDELDQVVDGVKRPGSRNIDCQLQP